MYMSFFASGYNCQITLVQYLKRIDKPKVTIKASFIIRVPALTRGQLYTSIQKTVGDKVTTSGTWQEMALSVQLFN